MTSPQSNDAPHPEDYCEACGRENVVWFAPSPIWNAVARRPDGDPMLCPVCFIKAAESKGYKSAWRVEPENESLQSELEQAKREQKGCFVPFGAIRKLRHAPPGQVVESGLFCQWQALSDAAFETIDQLRDELDRTYSLLSGTDKARIAANDSLAEAIVERDAALAQADALRAQLAELREDFADVRKDRDDLLQQADALRKERDDAIAAESELARMIGEYGKLLGLADCDAEDVGAAIAALAQRTPDQPARAVVTVPDEPLGSRDHIQQQ